MEFFSFKRSLGKFGSQNFTETIFRPPKLKATSPPILVALYKVSNTIISWSYFCVQCVLCVAYFKNLSLALKKLKTLQNIKT